jgi:hypothetical protein
MTCRSACAPSARRRCALVWQNVVRVSFSRNASGPHATARAQPCGRIANLGACTLPSHARKGPSLSSSCAARPAYAVQESADGGGGDGSTAAGSVSDSKMKLKQYEQPAELVTLKSGVQYRELLAGSGKAAQLGSNATSGARESCDIATRHEPASATQQRAGCSYGFHH